MLLIRSLKSPLLALMVVLSVCVGGAAASANEIEGIWSFNGGSVAIRPLTSEDFVGTVVTATTFATCPHPVGEVMWSNMKPQADGSFWGFHQWYHGTKCEVNPQLGQTAWRVLKNPDGSRLLRVCFSSPGTESQPTIAPDGTSAKTTYKCYDSALVAPLPTVAEEGSSPSGTGSNQITFVQSVILPKATACISQRSLKITLKDPKYDPLKEVLVRVNGHKVADVKSIKRLKKGLTLKKLPTGTYKVSIVATTVLNQHLSGSQTYKSCTKGSGKIKLRHVKKHHA
jgi:hypothetical protein